MSKFKIGDKVRVIKRNSAEPKLGAVGIVVRFDDFYPNYEEGGGYYVVEFEGDYEWYYNECDIELVALVQSLTTLPTDSQARKSYPMFDGCVRYFPAALAGVAKVSKLGNDKHNPGEELHHARGKSMDHADCIVRHLVDTADLLAAIKRKQDGVLPEAVLLEVSQMAWRALALSQEIHEQFGAPLASGAKNE